MLIISSNVKRGGEHHEPPNSSEECLQSIMADKDIRELSKNTSIESLSQTLEDRLPGK